MPDPLGNLPPPPPDDGSLLSLLGWVGAVFASIYIALRESALRWARNQPRPSDPESEKLNQQVVHDLKRLEAAVTGLTGEVHKANERISTIEGELRYIRGIAGGGE